MNAYYKHGLCEPAPAWRDHQPEIDLDAIFAKILPPSRPWHDDLTCWGGDLQHDIQVWKENGIVESIGFRLDLREDVLPLMLQLITAADELRCVIFVPGQHVLIEPTIFELRRYVMQSNAARFVQDPRAFLQNVSIEKPVGL